MNSELSKLALEKVGNVHVLINIISQRVRQLGCAGGAISRPMVAETASLGLADIALREVIEEKLGWVVPEFVALTRPVSKKRHPRHGGPKVLPGGNRSTSDSLL